MQLLNVALGGTLIQHLPDDVGHGDHRRHLGSFDDADHDVRLAPGSLAARACGELTHATKSHHHQAVDRLGEGLVASGWSVIDDLVEAVEVPDARWALGVQWHPEVDPGVAAWCGARGRGRAAAAARVAADRRVARRLRRLPAPLESRRRAPLDRHPRGRGHGARRRGGGAARSAAACKLPPPVVTATAAAAPFALCVLFPRTRARDAGACALQMWAYIATYKMPNDDPEALERRVRVAYPVRADRFLGGGTTPTLRLQRLLGRPGGFQRLGEGARLVALAVVPVPARHRARTCCSRHPERFARGAAQIYATFDLGLIGYWAVPTAPPWYAAEGGADGRRLTPELRRMMVEYGEEFWGSGWGPLYGFLGGNPLAAMPSLHFATSVMAAHLLAETGPVAGAVGWAVHRHARRGARLPRRALRRRPGGRPRAGRGDPRAARPRRRAAARRACPRAYRRWRRGRAHDRGGAAGGSIRPR